MYIGACRALSDVLAAMEWVQPDIPFLVEMMQDTFLKYGHIYVSATLVEASDPNAVIGRPAFCIHIDGILGSAEISVSFEKDADGDVTIKNTIPEHDD